jgi:hypothetical protein
LTRVCEESKIEMSKIMMEDKLDGSSKLSSRKTRPQGDEDINISTLSGMVPTNDNIDDDDLHDIHIKESEGECALKGNAVDMATPDCNCPIKTKKHNIDTKEAPKMDIIGDYWDKEMVTQVVDLLKEYEDFVSSDIF